MEAKTKRCARGDHEVPVTEFASKAASPDGLQAYCRTCSREYQADYQFRRKQALLERRPEVPA